MNKKAMITFLNRLGRMKLIGVFKRSEVENIFNLNEEENKVICSICDLNSYSIKMEKYDEETIKNVPKIIL